MSGKEMTVEPAFVKASREYQRAYYLKNREKKIAYQREYHRKNKPAMQIARRKARIAAGLPVRSVTPLATGLTVSDYNRFHHVERRAIKFLEERILVLQKVCGQKRPACVGCGCLDVFVLTINHKNGGGRKDAGSNPRALRLAILSGKRPVEDLDVRCHNCNILYEYERGYRKVPRGAYELICAMTRG